MAKIERKFLAHYIDASFGGIVTEYVRLGTDLEEFNEDLSPDVEVKKNIIGEQTINHNGYEVQSEVDPFYADYDDPLFEQLSKIANERLTGDACVTTKVDVLLKEDGTVVWAYREKVWVVPNSLGGDTSGVQIPFSIYNAGERVKGDFDIATKTFTPYASGLKKLLIEVVAGSGAGKTKVSDVIGEGNGALKYKVGNSITSPAYGDSDTGYSALTLNTDITCAAGNKIVVVEVGANGIVAASAATNVKVGA